MNKIYKVVWNTVRNCYVVGSELISSKSGRHSTSNGKSSSLKVTLTVLALCGMTALGSGVAPAYAADAGTAVASQYVAVLVNTDNNYYYTSRGRKVQYGDTRDFDGHSYHKETVSDETYWVRDGYTIKYEENERYPGAQKDNIIKAYKTSSYEADSSDEGLLKSNQIMVESAGISTLTGVDLDNVSGGTYVGATNSGSTSTPSSFNYMIKDDNGTYVDAGNTNFSKRFKAATKNTDGTYSYNGEVIANDNLYVVNEQVGVFLTSSGKVYTGKVFGANNEVLMTTKSDEGTMYSYWGADTPDPNTKLADMTIGQFNQALEKVNNNSKAVAGDTIKEIKTTAKTDGGTIDLVRRGQYNSATGKYEGEYTVGDGITITSHGGTNGEDVKINFSNGTTGFDVAAGSKVEAIKATESTTDITGLKINGETYNIKTGQTYTAGDNITIDGNKISATDTTLVAGKAEKKGDSYIVKDTAGNEVTLEDVASANKLTEVNNQVTENTQNITRNTQNITKNTTNITELGEKLKGAVMYDSTATGFNKNNVTLGGTTYDSATKTGGTKITNLARGTNDSDAVNFSQLSEVKDAENYVISGSLSKTDGTITLNRLKDGPVTITGLNDYVKGIDSYVTSATLNGNTLTLTRNQGLDSLTVDLSSLTEGLNTSDYRVVANPAKDSGGIYKPDASGNIELTVQDTKTGATATVQLSDIASATTVTNNYTTLDTKIDNTRTDITNEYNTAIDNAKTEIQNDYNTKIDAAKTHYYSVNSSATGEGSNYNNDGAVGLGSIAVGANAYANGRIGASAFGNRAYADGERALAVGYGSKAQGLAAIAIGTGSRHGADGTDAIAIGEQSYAKGNYTTAVGGYSQAVADGATAFGQQAVASGSNSTAIGIQSQALGNQSTAVGDYSKTEGIATAAFGGHSKTTGDFATALGYASKSVTRGTAVGAASSVTGETGTALGLLSTASANGSVALGAQSSADIDAGVTGYNPNAVEGEDLTSPTWTSTLGAVSVGAAATVDKDGNPVAQKTRQITNLAAGTVDTDAVNVAQLKKSRVELTDGTNTTVNSTNDETDGHVIYSVDVKTNGTINEGDTNIVTGDTVYNALQNVSWKAQVNGNDAKTVKKDGTLNFVNGDNIAITSNDNGDIKISTTGLASSGDLWTAQAGGTDVKAVNQKVNFVGSDHITVTGTDGQIQFEATGLADTDFTNITNNAVTKIQNIAKGEDVHIKADTYTVGNDGSVTMTYVDGNGNPVTGEAKITGIAKSDLSNITEEGDTYITKVANKAVKVIDGENTTVTPGKDGDVTTYAVNVDTSGKIEQNNTNIVTGDTVYNALQNVSWKAQVNGTDAKTVKKDGTLNFIDGDNIAITSNDNGDIKISTTGLASSGDLWTAQAGGTDVNAVNQKVNFVGSDHITVTGTDGQIKFEATGLADTDFTNITNNAITKIQNIAKGEDVHIKADTYTVGNDGSVTMTYVDGNGNPVTGEAKITGIAKSDLSNITNEGNNVINNIAKEAVKVVGGMNTTVEPSTTTDGPVEYKVNLNEDVNLGDTIYLNGSDGSISTTSGGAQLAFNNSGLTVSQAKNGLTNETRIDGATITVDGGAGNQTIINGSTAHIGSVLVNGGSGTATISGLTNQTTKYDGFANGSGRAATEEQLKEVDSKAAAAKTTVTKGKNITVDEAKAADGSSTYTVGLETDVVLGDNAIKLNGSDGSISATSGGAQLAFNNSGLTVSQAKDGLTNETRIDGATITVDGGAGNQTIINGSTAHIGSVLVNGGSGTATISGLTNQTTKYDGFANGSGRAATEEQLKEVDSKAAAAKTTVTKGKNITVDEAKAADGSSTYTVGLETDVVLGDNAIKLNGSDGSISATSGTSSLNFNDKGLSLSNGKNSTVINGGTITVNGGDSVISGTQATFGKITLNAESGSTITGLSNTTTKYDGFATAGRAATEEQLKEVAGQAGEAIKTAGKGWNLTTKGASDSKTNIAPGGTVDFSSSNDNLVISNAGADLSFSLSDNLDLTNNKDKKGSVKVGENTTLTDELLQVGKDVSLTASALNVGTSSLTTSALTVGGLTYISSSGLNANNRVISNVATGVADTDAVNVGQLKSAISGSQVSIKAGDGISVNKAGNQYTINVNIEGLSNEHGTVSVSTDSDSSVIPKSTPTESETITPAPAKRMNSLLVAEDAVVEPENSTSTGEKMYVKYTSNEVKLITDDITNPEDAVTLNDGEKIDFVGGKNITTSSKQGTDTDGKNYDKITFSLKDDISVTSVTADKVTINNGPTINENGIDMNGKNITNTESITINNGPTINSSGIDMNSQKITNLADGEIAEGSTDAVNGGQLYNTNQAVIANAENINSLSHSLNKLDSRINRVGAGAAALAALHPLDFDPDNKWDFAAGYGNYAGANAVAIGTYYRPNENTMFSIGGSFGGGENMINAGVSFKLGSGGSGITTSKTVMAKKIKEQDELLKAQDAKMKEQDEKIAKLEALVAQQGEMIQQALGKK